MNKKELEQANRHLKAKVEKLSKTITQQQLQIDYYENRNEITAFPLPENRPVGNLKVIREVKLFGEMHTFGAVEFNKDRDGWWFKGYWMLFSALRDWCKLSISRCPNISEFYSEAHHAWATSSLRRISQDDAKLLDPTIKFKATGKKEADNFDPNTLEVVECKCSTLPSDCSQLSPSDRQVDNIAYLDFYNSGSVDGSCNIYIVPYALCKPIIASKKKNQTVEDQLKQGRRAKIKLMDSVIIPNNIRPTYANIRLW